MFQENNQTDFYLNQTLKKRYQLKTFINKGRLGRVYQAENIETGGRVAVKLLFQPLLNAEMQQAFEQSAEKWLEIGSKSLYVVRLVDYGVNAIEQPYYVMEYLSGRSLKEFLDAKPLPLHQFIQLTCQICLGLKLGHETKYSERQSNPVIHGDINPNNVFIDVEQKNIGVAKLLDFGTAQFLNTNSSIEQSIYYIGRLPYSSPERLEGEEFSCLSDIYSLGVTMFEMISGRRPWQVNSNSLISWYQAHKNSVPTPFKDIDRSLTIPSSIQELIMSCLAKKPSDRPQSINEIIQTLKQLPSGSSQKNPKQVSSAKPLEVDSRNFEEINILIPSYLSATKPIIQQKLLPLSSLVTLAGKESIWPVEKPTLQIVFPSVFKAGKENLLSLWAMLPKQRIEDHLSPRVVNYFAFLQNPHPMVLWVTLLYHPQHLPCWFPCFLDLKTFLGQKHLYFLSETEYYPLLLFKIETPHKCINAIKVSISPEQRSLFKEWLTTSQTIHSIQEEKASKKLLKAQYELWKSPIIRKLESREEVSQPDITNWKEYESVETFSQKTEEIIEEVKWID